MLPERTIMSLINSLVGLARHLAKVDLDTTAGSVVELAQEGNNLGPQRYSDLGRRVVTAPGGERQHP